MVFSELLCLPKSTLGFLFWPLWMEDTPRTYLHPIGVRACHLTAPSKLKSTFICQLVVLAPIAQGWHCLPFPLTDTLDLGHPCIKRAIQWWCPRWTPSDLDPSVAIPVFRPPSTVCSSLNSVWFRAEVVVWREPSSIESLACSYSDHLIGGYCNTVLWMLGPLLYLHLFTPLCAWLSPWLLHGPLLWVFSVVRILSSLSSLCSGILFVRAQRLLGQSSLCSWILSVRACWDTQVAGTQSPSGWSNLNATLA